MKTPSSNLALTLLQVEECIEELALELGAQEIHVVYFVALMGFSPYQPFTPQLDGSTGSGEKDSYDASESVLSWLRAGVDPNRVAKRLRRMQCWEWGAIALSKESLAKELLSRYELGDAETDCYRHAIPGGVVICCYILPRWGDA